MAHAHLDFDGLLRASYGAHSSREAAHVAACGQCAAAVTALGARRDECRGAYALNELPEPFWLRWRGEIVDGGLQPARPPQRLATRSIRSGLAAAFALAALMAIAVLLLARPVPPIQPATRSIPLPVAAATHSADDRFLREVYGTLNQHEARSVSPIALLVLDGLTAQDRGVPRQEVSRQ